MTDRSRFTPGPLPSHVPPSQRGWLRFGAESGHPELVRFWLKADASNGPARSILLSRTDISRLCTALHGTPPGSGAQHP